MHLSAFFNVDFIVILNQLGKKLKICIKITELRPYIDDYFKFSQILITALILRDPLIEQIISVQRPYKIIVLIAGNGYTFIE